MLHKRKKMVCCSQIREIINIVRAVNQSRRFYLLKAFLNFKRRCRLFF